MRTFTKDYKQSLALVEKEEVSRFIRFCIVGLINTSITFIVFTLLRYAGAGLYFSNIFSYIAGVVNSFIWNKKWVYRSKGRRWVPEALIFLLFFGLCYGIQLVVFRCALLAFPEWLAQLAGMATYSISNFILNRLFNFNNGKH